MQPLVSSQSGASPPRHAPALQLSLVVQASPSSQEAVLSALTQPEAESQLSSVQPLVSSQLPSFTLLTILSFSSSQLSSVQATPSSVSGAVPTWQSAAASQVSRPSQNSLLSQFPSLTALTMTS